MVEQKMHCPVMVRAVGPNGNAICNLRAVDPMTAYELHVCTITALAKFLPAPRISIRLIWKPTAIGHMQVTVYLNQLTVWIEDIENYDEQFDPWSSYWRQWGPCHEMWEMPCLICGDITLDLDSQDNSDKTRESLCPACCPCACCENCICWINEKPRCISCVEPEEVQLLPPDKQRWLSFFREDDIPFEEIPRHRRVSRPM